MKYHSKWLQFVIDRFNPVSYSVMIIVFLSAHYCLFQKYTNNEFRFDFGEILSLLPIALGIFLFFFKLRLFDEIKDVEFDKMYHPERPLPRAVLKRKDILGATIILIVINILIFSFYGIYALISALITILYLLFMYKEFFARNWLRSHLTTYAITHTFIVVFISLTIFSALLGKPITKIPANMIYFSLAGWFIFNIFEFGRKTFAEHEEKRGVDSYSKIFGKFGAVLLVLVMAILSIIFLRKATNSLSTTAISFSWTVLLAILGIFYATSKKYFSAKLYRFLVSFYIVVAYLAVMAI